jgi:hypothetical protein
MHRRDSAMEIPYKGYTITPSSERQPDGRWLPVAQLETVHQGIVAATAPIRATAQDTRAARTDADAIAVKLAKAWIDANEGKPVEPDPSAEVRVPAPPPETRAPAARPTAAPPARPTEDPRRPAPAAEKLGWTDLCQALGLDGDDKVDRLSRLLVVHALLDRLLTLVVATKIASSRESTEAPDVEKALADIAPLPLPARVGLGSALGVLTPAVAESLAEIERVRHSLARHRPPRAKPPWDVGDVAEIASQAACDRCVRSAIQAGQDLMSSLRVRWPSPRQ